MLSSAGSVDEVQGGREFRGFVLNCVPDLQRRAGRETGLLNEDPRRYV